MLTASTRGPIGIDSQIPVGDLDLHIVVHFRIDIDR
jgi:hypothetical protein